jgi:hypothetical protein
MSTVDGGVFQRLRYQPGILLGGHVLQKDSCCHCGMGGWLLCVIAARGFSWLTVAFATALLAQMSDFVCASGVLKVVLSAKLIDVMWSGCWVSPVRLVHAGFTLQYVRWLVVPVSTACLRSARLRLLQLKTV